MTRDKTSCIILAGGRGKRIGGADKGLLQYGHKRLIDHVIDHVSPQVDDIVISANRNLDEYKGLGYPVVSDEENLFSGPLAGIASALAYCKHQWVLVAPCDVPSLPDNLVADMWQHTRHSSLVIVSADDRLQLVMLLHRSLATSIDAFLAGNHRTVMRWVDTVNHHILALDNEPHFHNINTCRDLDF